MALNPQAIWSMQPILPWFSLVAIIWLQAINTTNSDFSAYSSRLKSRLRITQVQLNYLAVASDAGKLFGWCSGIAAGKIPLPAVAVIGGVLGLIGYGMPYLFLSGAVPGLAYWQAMVLSVIAGNSICWVNTACYVASMRKFPADHGTVVALSTSYSALTAKIYIAVSQVIFGAQKHHTVDVDIYPLLNSVTPLAAGLLTAPFMKETKPFVPKNGRTGLGWLFVIAGATGTCSIVVSVVPTIRRIPVVPQAVLLLLVVSVVAVPIAKAVRRLMRKTPSRVAEEVAAVDEAEAEEVDAEVAVVEVGKEFGVWELVLSVDFWLYFWVYLCGPTLGLVYMNNLGQVSQSRGVSNSVLLSVTSSFGFFGKLASAPISAFARNKYMVSRPASMALLMAPTAGAFLLLLNPTSACLFVSTAVIGMCSGAMTSIAVSMTAELFGHDRFSINHNLVIANIPVGSFLFGSMAGYVYDSEERVSDRECLGAQCYHTTFVLWSLICLIGTVLSVVLYFRTRNRHLKQSSQPV